MKPGVRHRRAENNTPDPRPPAVPARTAKPRTQPRAKARNTGRPEARQAVTMADVAARLGISKMTVSRALNRTERSPRQDSEALRQRILRTCQDMGYVLDHAARTFSTKRSGFVAALIPALNNSNFSDTAHGLTAAVEASGLQVLLGYTDYDIATEERLIRAMLTRRPEGIVVTGGSHTPAARKLLKSAGVPVIETWDLLADPIEHTVGFSNAEATGALVRALHARGYRRIGFLGGVPASDARGAERRQGFEQAMRALKLDARRTISVGHAPVSMADGAQGVAQLMLRWPDVEAVVCVSDHAAFGALAECQRRGWQVPGRLAIAGFGGFEVGRACHPQLATVAVDCFGIGRAAGELMMRAIDAARAQRRLAPETVVVPYQVELRGST
jgi:LacI family transcriptional regulator, gluconate utilization system Gnt-I transcriptional repressor